MEKKRLAGQVIAEHDSLSLNLDADIIEYRQAMEPHIMIRLRSTAEKVKDKDGYNGNDFYIVLITIIDRVLR